MNLCSKCVHANNMRSGIICEVDRMPQEHRFQAQRDKDGNVIQCDMFLAIMKSFKLF